MDGVPAFDLSTDGTSGTVHTLAGTGALVVDEWAQIVATRSGGTVRLHVDGSEVATLADPGAVYDGGTDFLVGENLTGALDEMRLSITDRVAEDAVGKVRVDYVYNERNQLVTETSGGSVKTYSYDNNGNVLTIVEAVASTVISTESMTYEPVARTRHGPAGDWGGIRNRSDMPGCRFASRPVPLSSSSPSRSLPVGRHGARA